MIPNFYKNYKSSIDVGACNAGFFYYFMGAQLFIVVDRKNGEDH
jgi:hypothetical protein